MGAKNIAKGRGLFFPVLFGEVVDLIMKNCGREVEVSGFILSHPHMIDVDKQGWTETPLSPQANAIFRVTRALFDLA